MTRAARSRPRRAFGSRVEKVLERYKVLRGELGHFSEALLHKPELVTINKLDLFNSDPELVAAIRKGLREAIAGLRGASPANGEPFFVSGVSGAGLPELLYAVHEEVAAQRRRVHGKTSSAAVPLPDSPEIRNGPRR